MVSFNSKQSSSFLCSENQLVSLFEPWGNTWRSTRTAKFPHLTANFFDAMDYWFQSNYRPMIVAGFGFGLLLVLLLSRVTDVVVLGWGTQTQQGAGSPAHLQMLWGPKLRPYFPFPRVSPCVGKNAAAAQTQNERGGLTAGRKPKPAPKMAKRWARGPGEREESTPKKNGLRPFFKEGPKQKWRKRLALRRLGTPYDWQTKTCVLEAGSRMGRQRPTCHFV